ncbi:hypothetical protein ACTG9Q_32305 [Actinokineospora sp. 24-640]
MLGSARSSWPRRSAIPRQYDARLRGIAGSAWLAMRDTAKAAPVLRDALDRRAARDSKGRALLMLDLAECLVHDGEVEEAARVAVEASTWPRARWSSRSPRGRATCMHTFDAAREAWAATWKRD